MQVDAKLLTRGVRQRWLGLVVSDIVGSTQLISHGCKIGQLKRPGKVVVAVVDIKRT